MFCWSYSFLQKMNYSISLNNVQLPYLDALIVTCSSLIFFCVLAGTNNAVWTQAWRIVRKTKTYFALRFCIDYYAVNKPYNNHQSGILKFNAIYKSFSFSSIKSLYRLIMFRLLAISYTNIQLWNTVIGFKNLNRSCFFWTEFRQMINEKSKLYIVKLM